MSFALFIPLAILTLISAIQVITARKIMHAALWLGFSFITVAGVFLLLGAEFIAAAQVLVYVGAITTMIIYGIMLSNVQELRGDSERPSLGGRARRFLANPRRGLFPWGTGVVIAGIVVWAATRAEWPAAPTAVPENAIPAIGELLFTDYVLPFELVGIMLLAAAIGASVLVLRERATGDEGEAEDGPGADSADGDGTEEAVRND